jgi:nucleoside-diphosphate-sugar epimerase
MQDERVKVVVSGGTGVIGRAAVRALVDAGHDVDVVARSTANVDVITGLGARPQAGDLFAPDTLVRAYEGADVVVNLASGVPVGYSGVWPAAWKRTDDLRTRAVANVVQAARAAGVRRVVQESVSFVYADAGDAWVTERDPIDITSATEPVAVGESHVQEYAGGFRAGVLLRFGTVIGDHPQTRFWLKAAANNRPVGVGRPDQWSHVIHTDDVGPAVLAALHAPSGVYNVGAAPVLRGQLVEAFAKAAGVDEGLFMGPVLRRLAGGRIEPLARSLRISSDHFTSQTGWQPRRPTFDGSWLDAALRETQGVG